MPTLSARYTIDLSEEWMAGFKYKGWYYDIYDWVFLGRLRFLSLCSVIKVCNVSVCVKQAGSVISKLSREEEELEGLKTECNDAGCKIQSQQAEIESIRALVRKNPLVLKASHKHYDTTISCSQQSQHASSRNVAWRTPSMMPSTGMTLSCRIWALLSGILRPNSPTSMEISSSNGRTTKLCSIQRWNWSWRLERIMASWM